MARKPRGKSGGNDAGTTVGSQEPGQREAGTSASAVHVDSRPVEGARRLRTVELMNGTWAVESLPGDIVRLRPPPGATEEEVAAVVRLAKERGVAEVKVDWPNRPREVPEERKRAAHLTGREVVLRLASQANVADRVRLTAFCQQVMDRAGVDSAPDVAEGEPLTIEGLGLKNWKCFRGETFLQLEAKAYGISATTVGDPRRSNWQGKSSLVEAVDYALTGRLPRDCARKSDWITRGTNDGYVQVKLARGGVFVASVERSMSRGQPEQLIVRRVGAGDAVQGAAQEEVDRLLGVSREDVGLWCLRQGEVADILRIQEAKRLERFSDWCRLGPLEECAGIAAAARAEVEKERAKVRAQVERLDVEGLLRQWGFADEGALREAAEKAQSARRGLRKELEEGEVAERAALEREALRGCAERYEKACEEGKLLKDKLGGYPPAAELDAELAERLRHAVKAESHLAVVREKLEAARSAAEGEFGGTCPVAGAPCPAADFVRTESVRNRAKFAAAEKEWREALERREELARLHQEAADRSKVVHATAQRIEVLRAGVQELLPRVRRLRELEAHPAQALREGLREEFRKADAEEFGLRNRLALLEDTAAARRAAEQQLADLDLAAAVPEAAAAVFERARREIAENVLAEVSAYANDWLEATGLGLTVAVTWGRQGDGLADACGACGAAHPATRKVKHCARCGAERGPKVVESLDVAPSRTSGAAADLCAVAVVLGFSRWLRGDRGSAWATAVLDEATAHMDAAVREQFAGKLPRALQSAGFRQALVVSHHRETLEALPGKIVITSDGGISRAEVVA